MENLHKPRWPRNAEGELQPFKEDDFPGALNFTGRLSELDTLPTGWKTVLKVLKGVYLLTCPKTGLQCVGRADGMMDSGDAGKTS